VGKVPSSQNQNREEEKEFSKPPPKAPTIYDLPNQRNHGQTTTYKEKRKQRPKKRKYGVLLLQIRGGRGALPQGPLQHGGGRAKGCKVST